MNRTGLFLYFIFMGLAVLLAQLIVACVRLYCEGYMPSMLLVARAHSMSPVTIFKRILSRRHEAPPAVLVAGCSEGLCDPLAIDCSCQMPLTRTASNSCDTERKTSTCASLVCCASAARS